MSTDGRPMQDPGSANNGSSPDKNKEKKSVSNRIIYNKRRLEIRERSSAENPFVGGKRKEQLVKEGGTTTLQITARTLQPAERGSRTSVPHSVGWHSAKRTAKCKNAPQLQPPPAIPLQLLLLASGLQIPNQRNTPRNVQSTAESVQPVSAANFTRAVSGYGARRYTPCTFVTGPLLQLNTAHLGAGFISSGEDPRTVGFLRVHSESADGTETGVHLNQSHLAAGFISAGSDSISSPHQRWRNETLLERPDNLAQKFKHMADIHEEWTRGKEEMLQSEDFRQCRLNDVKGFKKKHEAFESDLATQQDSVKQIAAIAQELNALGYHEAASVNARCQLICDQWDRLDILTQKRRSAREEAERVLEIDHLYLEFAKRVARFNNVMDDARDYLVDMFIVHTMEEIQGLMDVHEQFKQTLGEADKEYKAIVELVHEVQVVASQFKVPGGIENHYTTLTSQVITGKWSEVKQLAPKRGQVLQAELMRQQSNERLRRNFAEKADVVGPWIEREMDALAAFEMRLQGSLEEQLKRLHEYEQAVAQYRPHLAELERSHQKVQEAMILENRYTHYTIETLRVDWDQLLTSIHSSVSNVTLGHMNEFRMSFDHREKNRTARLTSEEFMSCQVKLDYRSIMNIVDPNNTVCDHDDASLDFMTRESTNRETDEEIIKCIRTMTGDKPYITADELRRQLPPEVAEYCMQRMPAYKGHGAVPGALDYKSFSTALYGKSSL